MMRAAVLCMLMAAVSFAAWRWVPGFHQAFRDAADYVDCTLYFSFGCLWGVWRERRFARRGSAE